MAGFQLPDGLEGIHRVSGETADVLDHHHVKKPQLRVRKQTEKLGAVFDLLAGNALVRINLYQSISLSLGKVLKKELLVFQRFDLRFLVGADPAIGGNSQNGPPL